MSGDRPKGSATSGEITPHELHSIKQIQTCAFDTPVSATEPGEYLSLVKVLRTTNNIDPIVVTREVSQPPMSLSNDFAPRTLSS